jgi:hypothetical protein
MQSVTTAPAPALSLENLNIESTFTETLPGDLNTDIVPRQVHGALWSKVEPTPVSTKPHTIVYSHDVCELIGLDPGEGERPEFSQIFAGNAPLPNGVPYAQVQLLLVHRLSNRQHIQLSSHVLRSCYGFVLNRVANWCSPK